MKTLFSFFSFTLILFSFSSYAVSCEEIEIVDLIDTIELKESRIKIKKYIEQDCLQNSEADKSKALNLLLINSKGITLFRLIDSYPDLKGVPLYILKHQVSEEKSWMLADAFSRWYQSIREFKRLKTLKVDFFNSKDNSIFSRSDVENTINDYKKGRDEFFDLINSYLGKVAFLEKLNVPGFNLATETDWVKKQFIVKDPFFEKINFTIDINSIDRTFESLVAANELDLEKVNTDLVDTSVYMSLNSGIKNKVQILDQNISKVGALISKDISQVKKSLQDITVETFLEESIFALYAKRAREELGYNGAPTSDSRYQQMEKSYKEFLEKLDKFNEKINSANAANDRFESLKDQFQTLVYNRFYLELTNCGQKTTLFQKGVLFFKMCAASALDAYLSQVDVVNPDIKIKPELISLANTIEGSDLDVLIPQFIFIAQKGISITADSSLDLYVDKINSIESGALSLSQTGGRNPSWKISGKIGGSSFCVGSSCGGGGGFDPFKKFSNFASKLANPKAVLKELNVDYEERLSRLIDKTGISKKITQLGNELKDVSKVIIPQVHINPEKVLENLKNSGQALEHFTKDKIIDGTLTEISKAATVLARPDLVIKDTLTAGKVLSEQLGVELKDELNKVEKTVKESGKHLANGVKNVIAEVVRGSNNALNTMSDGVEIAQKLTSKSISAAFEISKTVTLVKNLEDHFPALKKWTDRIEDMTKAGSDLYFHQINGKTFYKVDGYRKAFNIYHQAILESAMEVKNLQDKVSDEIADKAISKLNSDLADAMKKYTEMTDKGVEISAAVASFDNVARAALVSFGTVVTGGSPFGAALGNLLTDRFIVENRPTDKEMLNGFAISVASGFVAQSVATSSQMYREAIRNMATRIGQTTVEGRTLTGKEVAIDLLMSAANAQADRVYDDRAIRDAFLGATRYVIEQAAYDRPINMEDAVYAGIRSTANGQLNHTVNSVVEPMASDIKEVLERKLAGIRESIYQLFMLSQASQSLDNAVEIENNTNDEARLRLYGNLDDSEKAILLKWIVESNKEANDLAAQKMFGKDYGQLSDDEFRSEAFLSQVESNRSNVKITDLKVMTVLAKMISDRGPSSAAEQIIVEATSKGAHLRLIQGGAQGAASVSTPALAEVVAWLGRRFVPIVSALYPTEIGQDEIERSVMMQIPIPHPDDTDGNTLWHRALKGDDAALRMLRTRYSARDSRGFGIGTESNLIHQEFRKRGITSKEDQQKFQKLFEALASLPEKMQVQRIRVGNNPDRILCIGMGMCEVVIPFKEEMKKKFGIEILTFSTTKEIDKDYSRFKEEYKNEHGIPDENKIELPYEILKKTLGYEKNKEWIEDRVKEGYTILDLGNPLNRKESPYYDMETEIVFGEKNE